MIPNKANELDTIDERMLALLRDDARQTIAQLAKALGVSRGQVYSRLARLEEKHIIGGYTVRLGMAFAAGRVRAHLMIKAAPRCRREVEQALAELPRVQAVYAVSGEYDIIAMIEAEDGMQLNDLIDDIGLIDGIERTTTSVILATKIER